MAKETAFENGRISNFQGLMTLTLDRVMLHTIVHHSSTFTYLYAKFDCNQSKITFSGRTDGRTLYVRMHDGRTFQNGFIRSTLSKSQPSLRHDMTAGLIHEIEETFCGQTDGRTDERTDI